MGNHTKWNIKYSMAENFNPPAAWDSLSITQTTLTNYQSMWYFPSLEALIKSLLKVYTTTHF